MSGQTPFTQHSTLCFANNSSHWKESAHEALCVFYSKHSYLWALYHLIDWTSQSGYAGVRVMQGGASGIILTIYIHLLWDQIAVEP